MAKKLAFDRVLFATVIALIGLGLAMVFSASGAVARDHGGGANTFLVKQSVAAAAGLLAMAYLMSFDYRRLRRPLVVYFLLVGGLLLLTLVLFSPTINGSHRWFLLGPFSFQPSEVAKILLVVYLAYQIERRVERQRDLELLLPAGVVAGLMAALILAEPDLGTVLVLGAVTLLMLFLAQVRYRLIGGLVGGALLAVVLLVVTEPYRMDRLKVFLDPELDPLGSGFQTNQARIAVGSGGLFGLGPGNSLQKLYFLPHPHSDFIFSIVAEELGMVGALAVIGLFGVLVWRGVRAGLRAPDPFGRHLAFGLIGTIAIQALINISVAVTLMPTTGIPLPFISYGGSSLLVTLSACGLLLNVSQHG